MADLVITDTQVLAGTSAQTRGGTYGEAITAGMPVYLKSSDSKLYKADNNVTAAEAAAVGIALSNGAAGQPGIYQTSGEIILASGALLTVGESYYVSGTAGKIMPAADLTTGSIVTLLGVGKTTSILSMNLLASGITHS